MASIWTIRNHTAEAGPLDMGGLGLARPTMSYRSMSADRCTIEVPGLEMDAVEIPGFPVAEDHDLSIYRDGTQVFRGIVTDLDRSGSGDAEGWRIVLAGPWWYLENLVAFQLIKVVDETPDYSTDPPTGEITFRDQRITQLVLYQKNDGSHGTTGEQIGALVTIAASAGGVLAPGSIMAGWRVPYAEANDATCAELIRQVMRWHPDAVAWWDYAPGVPTFNVARASTLATVALDLGGDGVTQRCAIKARKDLVRPGVTIYYPQTREVDGKVYHDLPLEDTAGSGAGFFRSPVYTIHLDGQQITHLRQDVETESWPETTVVPGETPALWWKRRVPKLAGIPVADLRVIEHTVALVSETTETLLADVPRELTGGGLADWMKDGLGEVLLEEPLVATALIQYQGADAAIAARFNEFNRMEATYQFNGTNAVQKEYSTIDRFEAAEAPPAGLAANILAGISHLHYEGAITIREEEAGAVTYMGRALNLTGGMGPWATMKAMITGVSVDVENGTTAVEFGPPSGYLGPNDLMELLRAKRDLKATYRANERTDAEVRGSATQVRGVRTTPTRNGDSGGGGGSTPYPFMARPAVAADPLSPPADLAFRLTVGKGLVRGETEWVANSNAGAEFTLAASKSYVFYLAAGISAARELTDLEIDFAESGDVPVSPAGDAMTGAPPTASYGVVFELSTDGDGIDWTSLVHTQRNFVLAVVPRVVECDTQTLVAVWL